MLLSADLVLVMAPEHYGAVGRMLPRDAMRKVQLIEKECNEILRRIIEKENRHTEVL